MLQALKDLIFGHTIPQEEIDAEARRIVEEHGPYALKAAYGNWERTQWAKGDNSKHERSARVLRAVKRLVKTVA